MDGYTRPGGSPGLLTIDSSALKFGAPAFCLSKHGPLTLADMRGMTRAQGGHQPALCFWLVRRALGQRPPRIISLWTF